MPKLYIKTHTCPVCGKSWTPPGQNLSHVEAGRVDFEYVDTGDALCELHQKEFDQGYVFLIAVEAHDAKRYMREPDKVNPRAMQRTGTIVSMKRAQAANLFQGWQPPANGIMFAPEDTVRQITAAELARTNPTKH